MVGYIVVFKDSVSQKDIDKHADDLTKAGELCLRYFCGLLANKVLLAGGKVTAKYDSVMKVCSFTSSAIR